MSALQSLKLVNAKRRATLPPVQYRREKLSKKIWEQIQLANAFASGSTFTVKRFKTVRDNEGNMRSVELQKRVKQWWFVGDNGKTCVNIRYGSKVLELAKGKSAIEIAANAELVPTLELIRAAVDAGELDAQIEIAATKLKNGFVRQ